MLPDKVCIIVAAAAQIQPATPNGGGDVTFLVSLPSVAMYIVQNVRSACSVARALNFLRIPFQSRKVEFSSAQKSFYPSHDFFLVKQKTRCSSKYFLLKWCESI